ncbi:MAG: transglycosylase domain-containing protein [Bacteroidales bacterium]|nr:transglycosylase domain-containing protein [Bacteroidales bacterium]
MSKNTPSKSPSKAKKYIKIFWLSCLITFIIPILLFILISLGAFGFMPSFEELENPKSNLASQIYSADGELLGTYYIENRSNVNFKDISPNVINALIATEDIRFEDHSGIDFRGLGRVFVKNFIFRKKSAGGGSTITQQLAKNLFPRKPKASKIELVITKFKEWVTAIKLERNYSKQEIAAMYLNVVDFGSHAFGIKSAAATFFGKDPSVLTIEEAAVLIGLLKAPTWFSPVRNYDRSIARRNVVLGQMQKYNFITETELDSISELPINLSKYQVKDHHSGLATYFREYLRKQLIEWSKTALKPDGTPYNIYKDGLKIYTTIDSRMQKYAEEAVSEYMGNELQPQFFNHWKGYKNAPFDRMLSDEDVQRLIRLSVKRSDRYISLKAQGVSEDSINVIFNTPIPMTVFSWKGDLDTIMSPLDSIWYHKHFLHTGLMAMEPKTGFVKAYVGGINYRFFQFDHVKISKRQVGSTFKPFVYTLAMQEGEFSPCSKVPNVPVTFEMFDGSRWTPKNSNDAREGEMVTLKWALANSVNYISAYLMKRYSPQAVVQIARKMGVTSPIDEVYSICLGTPDLTVYEMVGAYSTFVNKGVYVEPIFITKIEDKNGNIIQNFLPKTQEAMNEETAYLMIELMKGVVESGTSVRLRYRYGLTNPIAGKTGTTQNNSDGWFIGLTPDLAAGVWTGGEDRSIRFRSINFGQGAHMALPIWALFMKKVYADRTINISQGDFEKPENLSIETDCNTYEQQHHNEIFL